MTREEAIQIIRETYHTDEEMKALESLIPELCESEDERIRNEMIEFFQCSMYCDDLDTVKIKRWVDYLEKQKDRMAPVYDNQDSFESALEKAWNDYHNGYENVDKLEDDYVECAHAKGFREGYLFGIEKQKEQKPAEWSEEDNLMLTAVIQTLENFGPYGTIGMQIDWLKSLRPKSQGVYKTAIESIFKMCESYEKKGIFTDERAIDFLGNVRVKCKDAIECVPILDEPSWKPSEEQMKALEVAFRKDGDDNYRNAINSLYNDLKKL